MDLFPVFCPRCKVRTPAEADYCPECGAPLRLGLPPRDESPPLRPTAPRHPPRPESPTDIGMIGAQPPDREMLPVGLALLSFWGLLVLGALIQPEFPSPECLLGLVLLLWNGVYLADQPFLPVQISGAFGLGVVLGITFSSLLAWLRTQL